MILVVNILKRKSDLSYTTFARSGTNYSIKKMKMAEDKLCNQYPDKGTLKMQT